MGGATGYPDHSLVGTEVPAAHAQGQTLTWALVHTGSYTRVHSAETHAYAHTHTHSHLHMCSYQLHQTHCMG